MNGPKFKLQIPDTYPKHWYSLSPSDQLKFEEYMKELHPKLFEECENYLGHRTIMTHPDVILKKMNLQLYYGKQTPGPMPSRFQELTISVSMEEGMSQR